MIKKFKCYFLIIGFLTMIILPQIIYRVFDLDKKFANSENRVLAEKPNFSIKGLEKYPSLYEQYFNDHVSFKELLVRINQKVNYAFGIAENNDTVLGKDGFLFCKIDKTMEDYQGVLKYTDEQLKSIATEIVKVDQYYKSIGKEFILFIAPNKESIYDENVPNKFVQFEKSTRADQLYEYLINNTEIKVIFPKEEMKAYKKDFLVYYKLDTHWSDLGAYISTNYMLKSLGFATMKDIQETEIIENGQHQGDLANMLNLKDIFEYEPELTLKDFSTTNVEMVYSNPHHILFNEKYTSDSGNEKKIYIVGDSFSTKLFAFSKYNFAESTVIHRMEYKPGMAETDGADIVVCEFVERYIDQIVQMSTIFIPSEDVQK